MLNYQTVIDLISQIPVWILLLAIQFPDGTHNEKNQVPNPECLSTGVPLYYAKPT